MWRALRPLLIVDYREILKLSNQAEIFRFFEWNRCPGSMLQNLGLATCGYLPFLPNVFLQEDHLDLPHPVWTVMPSDESVRGLKGTSAIASWVTTNRAWLAIGMKDVPLRKAKAHQRRACLESTIRRRRNVHIQIVGYSTFSLGTGVIGGAPVPPLR